MDAKGGKSGTTSSKRRSLGMDPWDKLGDDIMEVILARLLVTEYFCCQLVCKKWGTIIRSPTFRTTSQQLVNRLPWFFMVDEESSISAAYDMEADVWRQGGFPLHNIMEEMRRTPVASSNGLMCFITGIGTLMVCNPFTGSMRLIQDFNLDETVEAITMRSWASYYKVFVVLKKSSDLQMKVYSSEGNTWTSISLTVIQNVQSQDTNKDSIDIERGIITLEKYAGKTSINDCGSVVVYYFTAKGLLVGCDTKEGVAYTYTPAFLNHEECAFDLVECGERILIAVLADVDVPRDADEPPGGDEAHESRVAFQVFELDHERGWRLLTEMPEDMSKNYDDTDIEINCAGYGDYIMTCIFSETEDLYDVVTYNMDEDVWDQVPTCEDRLSGDNKFFVKSYAIMPDLHSHV